MCNESCQSHSSLSTYQLKQSLLHRTDSFSSQWFKKKIVQHQHQLRRIALIKVNLKLHCIQNSLGKEIATFQGPDLLYLLYHQQTFRDNSWHYKTNLVKLATDTTWVFHCKVVIRDKYERNALLSGYHYSFSYVARLTKSTVPLHFQKTSTLSALTIKQ